MLYYALPLAFFYAMFGFGRIVRQPTAWFFIGTLPMIALALLRGNVGVDTPNYIGAIEVLREVDGNSYQLFEPLFQWLLSTIGLLPVPAWVVLAIISLTTTTLLIYGWLRVEPSLIIFSGIYAQFFVDMTMNGIRYGLAFSLIVFGANYLLSKRFHVFWIFVLAATFIQFTSAVLGVMLYLLHERRWRALAYAVFFGWLVAISFSDHLLLKIAANELEQIPGALSGVVPLAATWMVLLVWRGDANAKQEALTKIYGIAVLSLVCYGITQLTYAGLRMQQLVLFLTSLTLACHLRGHSISLRRHSVIGLLVIGMVLGTLKLRNFSQSNEDALALFIPYKFIWEER